MPNQRPCPQRYLPAKTFFVVLSLSLFTTSAFANMVREQESVSFSMQKEDAMVEAAQAFDFVKVPFEEAPTQELASLNETRLLAMQEALEGPKTLLPPIRNMRHVEVDRSRYFKGLLFRAESYFEKGKYEESLKTLNGIFMFDPYHPEAQDLKARTEAASRGEPIPKRSFFLKKKSSAERQRHQIYEHNKAMLRQLYDNGRYAEAVHLSQLMIRDYPRDNYAKRIFTKADRALKKQEEYLAPSTTQMSDQSDQKVKREVEQPMSVEKSRDEVMDSMMEALLEKDTMKAPPKEKQDLDHSDEGEQVQAFEYQSEKAKPFQYEQSYPSEREGERIAASESFSGSVPSESVRVKEQDAMQPFDSFKIDVKEPTRIKKNEEHQAKLDEEVAERRKQTKAAADMEEKRRITQKLEAERRKARIDDLVAETSQYLASESLVEAENSLRQLALLDPRHPRLKKFQRGVKRLRKKVDREAKRRQEREAKEERIQQKKAEKERIRFEREAAKKAKAAEAERKEIERLQREKQKLEEEKRGLLQKPGEEKRPAERGVAVSKSESGEVSAEESSVEAMARKETEEAKKKIEDTREQAGEEERKRQEERMKKEIEEEHEKRGAELEKQRLVLEKKRTKREVKRLLKDAKRYYRSRQYSKAIATYEEIFRLDPENKKASNGIDKAREKLILKGDDERAEKKRAFEREVEQKVDDYAEQAQGLQERGKFDAAKIVIEKGLMLAPDNQRLKELKKSNDFAFRQNLKRRETLLTETQEEKINRLVNKGIKQFLLGNYEEAKGYFEKVLRLDPNDERARNSILKIDRKMKYLKTEEYAA